MGPGLRRGDTVGGEPSEQAKAPDSLAASEFSKNLPLIEEDEAGTGEAFAS